MKRKILALLLAIAYCLLPGASFAGRIYTCQFNAVAVTAQQDFFEILAPTDAIVVIHDIHVSQDSEAAETTNELLRVLLKRGVGSVTSGTGGTAPTAQQKEDGDTAFGGTCEVNNTTKMVVGTGSIDTLTAWTWNVVVPFDKIFTPETRPVISPGNRLTLELATTPADSVTMQGTITLEEIGG